MASVNVLSITKTLELLGEVLVGANVVGDDLILTTRSGVSINAGNVRGSSSMTPTATATSFSPTASVAASNVQAALVELGVEITAVDNAKADVSAAPKFKAGRVSMSFVRGAREVQAFTNVWSPTNYFISAPRVLVMPVSGASSYWPYYGVTATTTTGFTIAAQRTDGNFAGTFNYLAVGA